MAEHCSCKSAFYSNNALTLQFLECSATGRASACKKYWVLVCRWWQCNYLFKLRINTFKSF